MPFRAPLLMSSFLGILGVPGVEGWLAEAEQGPDGAMVITVTFGLDRKLADAALDVRDKVSVVVRLLPAGPEPPVVAKFDVESLATLSLAISGDRDLRDVTEIADKTIRPSLETVDGVGAILLVGGSKRGQRLAGRRRLDAYRISSAQVKAATWGSSATRSASATSSR